MSDIYKQLAIHLNNIPNGYPETESGVELKILKKLFGPDEAQLACHLDIEFESSQSIAKRLKRDERETSKLLKGMYKKGLIEIKRGKGSFSFKLIPFVVGFYEHQNGNIDKEFAELFEEYYKEAFYRMMTISPSVHRVIPVEQAIPVNIEVMPYERASLYVEKARSWGVIKCICRVQKQLIGEGCHHPIESCLLLSAVPGQFDRAKDIRSLTKSEAYAVLEEANKAGLVHTTNNVQEGISYICNCCTCSCGVLRGIKELGQANSVASSDFFARVDQTLCSGCEECVNRCQFDALKMVDDVFEVDPRLCVGCGLCISSCTTEAISLELKSEKTREIPPISEKDWLIKRAQSRGMPFDPTKPITEQYD